ncbi:SRPBCC family protein [Dermatophilaceae bacterium Soc4.6]
MITFDLDIDAPLERVWAVWTDAVSWPRWNPTVTRVKPLGGAAALDLGSRARLKQPQLPASTWTVTVWEPFSQWEWQARSAGVTTAALHELTDLGGGRTHVVATVLHTGLLAGAVGRLSEGLTRQYVEREVAALARRCEGGSDLDRRIPPDGLRR